MKITDLTKEELESKSYDDIAYIILESTGEKIKITDLFKQICDLLSLSETEYEAKIADFFQVLSTDHRFIMLENGFWDLKIRHQAKIIMEEDEEEDITMEESLEEEDEEEEENIYYNEEDSDDEEDDLQGLAVVSDDTDEENSNLD